jgi:hypothetical protein
MIPRPSSSFTPTVETARQHADPFVVSFAVLAISTEAPLHIQPKQRHALPGRPVLLEIYPDVLICFSAMLI